jgi:hypothetical protein
LQYEGKPWPTNRPGIESIERSGGTGAQFVNFSNDGKLNLFYIGKRYRDAQTGEVLLTKPNESPFRDTKNCAFWYETTWSHLGKTRKVKVDLCQAFWIAREKFWDERYPKYHPNRSFWKRMDLNRNGTPNNKYTLPWQEDSGKYFHYHKFRHIKFVRLNKYFPNHVFAVIHGRGCATCTPKVPAIKEIYLLVPGIWKWRKLEPHSDYYPPEEFFSRYNGIFADITGDGIDDAIIASGNHRKTYINTGIYGKRWLDSPRHYLPRACDLGNGSCQLIDLDNDQYPDLFIGNGSKVYLNHHQSGKPSIRYGYMSAFTDREGKQISVLELNKKNTPQRGEINMTTNTNEQTENRSDFYGPFFLSSYENCNDGTIYYVDKPEKLPQGAIAVMVRSTKPELTAMMNRAMNGGQAVSVAPGQKYWVGQGKLGWEIYKARVEFNQ